MTGKTIGDRGERIAERQLLSQGYELLARNYRYGHYELDLVMRQRDTIVFVEVKARSSTAHGLPAEFVTAQKRRRTWIAAQAYLQQNGLTDAPARIDVVEVFLPEERVHHIENAFGENG